MKLYLIKNSRGEYAAYDGGYFFTRDIDEALLFPSMEIAQQWWENDKIHIMAGEPKKLKCRICSIAFSAPAIEKELK